MLRRAFETDMEISMKRLGVLGLLLFAFSHTGAWAAGNPGRSAMDCVSASRVKDDIVFKNSCSYKVFVVWCGELKYSKKRCGDGPAGNSFYTHSDNIGPGGETWARGVQTYRYAACEGGIGFGKSEIKDAPDGSFQCIASGSGAQKKIDASASPVGIWQVATEKGEKLTLTLNADGSSLYAGEYPGRWTRQGTQIRVQSYADGDFLRKGENPSVMELEFSGSAMNGTQLAQRVGNRTFPALKMTLTR